ncbi:MAG: phage portal protein, partial [Pyrinomonadaceae bacterium]|nr:phage portal protein [Pyrinomonadaceae bacterium]
MLSELKYALGIGGLVSFYGIVSIGVWLLGDKFGAGNTEKIVIIALVLITLPFVLLISFFVSRRRKKAEAQEQLQVNEEVSEAQPNKLSTPLGNDDLTKSAEEAVQFLKNSNLDIYSLPWYLVIGSPKSGKTSLLLGSGLNFQNLPSQRQSEQKLIRPTRNIDWRITSDAVFIDTAGRYQTEGIDAAEWSSLTETLKKYRGNRPLDGVILAVNTERLLTSEERNIEEQAKVLRARIDEVIQRTKVKFPIYLIFTHADAIEGFRDSFSTSQKDGENLVWGSTIPLEQSDSAQTLFDSEYDLLQNSTMKRRLMRLSAPFSPLRQLRIFNFPLHFGSARRKLGHFVSTLFRPNPFSESPFLRGFYFTAVPVNSADAANANVRNQQTIGKSYFAEKLFRDVILRDRNLTQTFISQKQKPPILGWLALIFGTFLITTLLGLSAISLYKNKVLLDDAVEKATALNTIIVADKGRDVLAKNPTETRMEVDAVENLRESLAKLDDYERNSPPLLMRFGFYSGNRIMKERLMSTYYNAIEQARDMDRNDALIGILADRRIDNIVQGGFKLDPKTGDKGLDLELWNRWQEYATTPDLCDITGEMTWHEMERVICRAECVDGDIVAVGTENGSIQLIESHLIQTLTTVANTFLGVETDSYG